MFMSLVVTIQLDAFPLTHPNCRKVLDCASPLALLDASNPLESARGLAQSKTLSRDENSSLCRNHPSKRVSLQHHKHAHEHRQRQAVPEDGTQHRSEERRVGKECRSR